MRERRTYLKRSCHLSQTHASTQTTSGDNPLKRSCHRPNAPSLKARTVHLRAGWVQDPIMALGSHPRAQKGAEKAGRCTKKRGRPRFQGKRAPFFGAEGFFLGCRAFPFLCGGLFLACVKFPHGPVSLLPTLEALFWAGSEVSGSFPASSGIVAPYILILRPRSAVQSR